MGVPGGEGVPGGPSTRHSGLGQKGVELEGQTPHTFKLSLSLSIMSSPVATESKKREVPEEAKAEQGSPKKIKAESPVPVEEPEAKAEAKVETEREQLEAFLKSLRSELEEVVDSNNDVCVSDRDRIQSKAIDAYFQKRKETEAKSLNDLIIQGVRVYTQALIREMPNEKRDAEINKLVADYQAKQ